jgi:hypothetical protein
MTPLTNEEFATVQRFCQLMSEKIAALGLDVFVESNFRDFSSLRRQLAPKSIQNPSFDPDHCALSLHNAFWLRAVDQDGDTVAMMAQRVFDTKSFLDELKSLRLWHDLPDHLNGVLRISDCEFAERLTGRVGHAGGLWIEPTYRKKNLSGLMDHLSRGLCLRNFWFDYMTGNIGTELAATGIGFQQYGFPEVGGRLEFDFFQPGQKITFVIGHMSRAQSVERMHQWLLLPERNSIKELDEAPKILVD